MDNETKSGEQLLTEFPPHTYEMWRQAAEALLKGAPFEKRLITPTYEGFDLQPIYNQSDVESLPHMAEQTPGAGLHVRGPGAAGYRQESWKVSQELSAATPAELNKVILHELSQGQNELNLWFDAATRAGLDPDAAAAGRVGICGVSAASVADFVKIFEGVELPYISVYLRAGGAPEALAALFLAAAREKGVDPRQLTGAIEIDPLAYLVENGEVPGTLADTLDGMARVTRHVIDEQCPLQTIVVQGHPYHNGGASSVQEMAATLATAVYYLRELAARGLPLEELVPRLRLSLSIGSQYFIEIGKFRAMRLLWNRVLEALEVPAEQRKVHLHARTGLWNKTRRDPYVNSLRATTEAFSAVVAGVDSLHVSAFDEVVREPDEFSRRFSRNVHHVLAEECDLTKVIDPAGGSWAVEWLTGQLADRAWAEFQKIEANGGIVSVLQSGDLQKAVAATLECKRQSLAKRRDTLVGTNNYPNGQEKPLPARSIDYTSLANARRAEIIALRRQRDDAELDSALVHATSAKRFGPVIDAARAGATLHELQAIVRASEATTRLEPIPLSRGAAAYEALIERVEALGEAASLLQVNFGPSRRYRARADWTSAFFRVAGFPVLSDDDFLNVEDAVAAAESGPAKVAIIVSDDATYAERAVEVAKALKAARPELYLILAGAPGENEPALREAGVDDFVHVRVNNYAFNDAIARRVGA
ncbi:MAG: methylmalonyl-CoA mutase family protein [Opitutales bacterium]